jgi:hypothetical protein
LAAQSLRNQRADGSLLVKEESIRCQTFFILKWLTPHSLPSA